MTSSWYTLAASNTNLIWLQSVSEYNQYKWYKFFKYPFYVEIIVGLGCHKIRWWLLRSGRINSYAFVSRILQHPL